MRRAGPNCLNLPNSPWSQKNPVRHQPDMDDGVDETHRQGHQPGRAAVPQNSYTNGAGWAGSPEESSMLKSLLGPALGLTAGDVPDLGVLLVGPMARGAEVSLR